MNFYNIKKQIPFSFWGLLLIGLLPACNPQQDDAIVLGPTPSDVSFTIEEKVGEPNTYILTNTSSGAFLYSWDLGNGEIKSGEEVEAYYQLQGDYSVTLRAFNDGGFTASSKVISVAEDDLGSCPYNDLAEFLTDCDRVWKMKPVTGAYWVGPDDNTTWWEIMTADIALRPCAFDDEWTFTTTGEMIYDTKGDLWAEDYMGFDFQCVMDDQLTGSSAAWASGTHTYLISEGTPDQLTVNGTGAFIGLPKAANGMEVTEPVSSITYDVIQMEETDNVRTLRLEVNFGPGVWRFILFSEI